MGVFILYFGKQREVRILLRCLILMHWSHLVNCVEILGWPDAAVYDVTIVYPGSFPQTEKQLIAGNLPDGVSFHIKRYELGSNIPDSASGAETWLRSRWDEKDQRIEQFHSSYGRFVGELRQSVLGLTEWIPIYYYLSMAFWIVFMLLMVIVYAMTSLMWWLSIAISLFFVTMGYRYNGFEYFQAKYSVSREAA